MEILNNKDLQGLNTFGIAALANQYVEVRTLAEIQQLVSDGCFQKPFLVLGGGSNVLFTKNFDGLVVKNQINGIEVLQENEHEVVLNVGAGENWHKTVLYCVERNWCGLENLSLIPGCVGAAPIQNIGAYGVEIKDVLNNVHFIDLETGQIKTLAGKDCAFEYRNSIFKNELKGKVIVTSIDIRLTKQPHLKLDYGAIKDELAKQSGKGIGIKEVSDAVIAIRQSKLPDPNDLGNSGSFFKNPVISKREFTRIVEQFPDLRSFEVDANHMKLAAGWLIEQCGWKGKRVGNTGSHAKQALVLVNYGDAQGQEVKDLAFQIIQSVNDKFGVELEPEVNII